MAVGSAGVTAAFAISGGSRVFIHVMKIEQLIVKLMLFTLIMPLA
jgi:hypothetical protein